MSKRTFFELCAKRMDMFKKHNEIVYKQQRPSFPNTWPDVVRD